MGVVITGIGVRSPLGCTVEECFMNLELGTRCVRDIENFETGGFSQRAAGEVRHNGEVVKSPPDVDRKALFLEGSIEDLRNKTIFSERYNPEDIVLNTGGGLDYVDIFYHHRMDPETPLEETMEALAQIVRSGKALYVGISNYDGETMKRATDILEELHCPFIINQNSYNIFNRTIEKNGLKQAAAERRKGIISFSPLAQGMLTDRYLNGIPKDSRVNTDGRFLHADQFSEERLNSIRSLNAIAAERGESLAQMALKWILRDGIVTSVLIGASRPQQILENLKVLDSASFSEEELKKIDECSLAL